MAARRLAGADWPVRIALLGPRGRLGGAARHQGERWRGVLESLELVVDATIGAGLSRAIEGSAQETLVAAVHRDLPIVAVDVPSGLMGDTGEEDAWLLNGRLLSIRVRFG